MKSIVFLALVAAAVAHFPYADLEDKFRVSSLMVAGSDNAIVAEKPYAWYFSPINNQLLPTFQLRFPEQLHQEHPAGASRHPEGVIYTVALDHLAEVVPTETQFSTVPGSTISFSSVSWYFEDTYWWYDEETFGEVITFSLVPWCFDWDDEDFHFHSHSKLNLLDNWLDTAIWLSIYPDSFDDLVDISIWIDGYRFLDIEGQHVALFWKVVSSVGEKFNMRNVPLSIDFNVMSFELDPTILVSEGGRKPVNRPNATKPGRPHGKPKNKGVSKRVMQALGDASAARKAAVGKRHHWAVRESLKRTTGQIWINGGFIVTVVGLVPSDIPDDCQLFVTVTLALRDERI